MRSLELDFHRDAPDEDGVFWENQPFENAISRYSEAEKARELALLSQQLEKADPASKPLLLRLNQQMGALLISLSRFEVALSFLERERALAFEIHDRKAESESLNDMGILFWHKSDYAAALDFLNRSLKIREEIGDINGEAVCLTNIGAMLFEQNKVEEAVPPLLQAFQIFQKIGSPNVKAPDSYLGAVIQKIGKPRFDEIFQKLQNG